MRLIACRDTATPPRVERWARQEQEPRGLSGGDRPSSTAAQSGPIRSGHQMTAEIPSPRSITDLPLPRPLFSPPFFNGRGTIERAGGRAGGWVHLRGKPGGTAQARAQGRRRGRRVGPRGGDAPFYLPFTQTITVKSKWEGGTGGGSLDPCWGRNAPRTNVDPESDITASST